MNQSEIVVKRLNVFCNSEDRTSDVGSDSQSGGASIKVPLDNMQVRAGDNQFLRLKLQTFACANTFDNHLSFDQRMYLFLGENVIPKAADIDAPQSTLRHSYLTLPSYSDYTSLMIDATQAVAALFQTVYSPSAWSLEYTDLRGFGESIPSVSAGAYPGVAGNPPLSYSNIGEYRQNGVKALLGTFTLTQTTQPLFYGAPSSGITAPQFDNSTLNNQFFLTSAQSSDIYLLLGGRKSSYTTSDLASAAAYEANPTLGDSTTDTSKQLLNVTVGVSSIGGGLYKLTVTVQTVMRMQLRVNHQLYLRTNLITNNFSTDNMNQREGVQQSSEVANTGIWACFPLQQPTIYYQNTGGDQWTIDLSQRSLSQIQLFVTNKDNLVPQLDNPNTECDFNLSFECCFTVEIIERAKIMSTIPERNLQGEAPARFSHVLQAQNNGGPPRQMTIFNEVARISKR